MWRSSGILYLPYILRTLKRVYKPTVVISTKLLKMSSFLLKHGVWLQRESGVDLSDIYVWRMGLAVWLKLVNTFVLNADLIIPFEKRQNEINKQLLVVWSGLSGEKTPADSSHKLKYFSSLKLVIAL